MGLKCDITLLPKFARATVGACIKWITGNTTVISLFRNPYSGSEAKCTQNGWEEIEFLRRALAAWRSHARKGKQNVSPVHVIDGQLQVVDDPLKIWSSTSQKETLINVMYWWKWNSSNRSIASGLQRSSYRAKIWINYENKRDNNRRI